MQPPTLRATPRLTARLIDVAAGDHTVEPGPVHRLILHHGPAVHAMSAAEGVRTPRHLQREGDMDFIPAGGWGWWRDEEPSTVIALTLCPSVFLEAAQRLGRSLRSVRLRPWLHWRDDRLATLARLAPRQGDASAEGSTAFCDAVAGAIAVQLLCLQGPTLEPAERVRPLEGRRLKTVLAFIDENLDQPLTLDTLARQAGLRRSHFAAAFRLATRQSPRQYIIRRRVEVARELLAKGATSISDVAFQTGFSHQSHLSRAMRKITGLTPRELSSGGGGGEPIALTRPAPGRSDPPRLGGPGTEDPRTQ